MENIRTKIQQHMLKVMLSVMKPNTQEELKGLQILAEASSLHAMDLLEVLLNAVEPDNLQPSEELITDVEVLGLVIFRIHILGFHLQCLDDLSNEEQAKTVKCYLMELIKKEEKPDLEKLFGTDLKNYEKTRIRRTVAELTATFSLLLKDKLSVQARWLITRFIKKIKGE